MFFIQGFIACAILSLLVYGLLISPGYEYVFPVFLEIKGPVNLYTINPFVFIFTN